MLLSRLFGVVLIILKSCYCLPALVFLRFYTYNYFDSPSVLRFGICNYFDLSFLLRFGSCNDFVYTFFRILVPMISLLKGTCVWVYKRKIGPQLSDFLKCNSKSLINPLFPGPHSAQRSIPSTSGQSGAPSALYRHQPLGASTSVGTAQGSSRHPAFYPSSHHSALAMVVRNADG